jgi:hypothetical protein
MATVLVQGKLPPDPGSKKYVCRCRECDSKIEFLRKEGTVTRDHRDGDFITFHCPVCNEPINHAL